MVRKHTHEQRLAITRMALMSHKTWCLYTGLLMIGKLEVQKSPPGYPPTARTNGRDVFVDPRFMDTLTDPELRFLLLHENEHKALRQLSTYEFLFKKNQQVANIAADFVVNLRIKDADAGEGFVTMPKPIKDKNGKLLPQCIDEKYRGWSTKQVFDDLMKNAQQPPKGGKGKGDGSGEPQFGQFDEHDHEGAEALTEEEKEELKKEIESAVRQGALLAGKMGGDKNRLLQDVLESQIRWQEILAEFVKNVTQGRNSSSWAKVNRRWVSSGLYLPSPVSEAVGALVVGIDASGSTWSGNQLEGFIGELVAICNEVVPERVTVLWWDTQIQKVQEYNPTNYASMLDTLSIQGGGGTSPSCVTDWLLKQEPRGDYVAAIMLSDGYVGADWGDWSTCGANGALPVLWCLNQKGAVSPVGQTLYIEES